MSEISMLNTHNVKTRRLSYFREITNILKTGYLNIDILVKKLEDRGEDIKKYICEYIDDKGCIVRTQKHYPARRYINLAVEIGWLNEEIGKISLAKNGRLLHYIQKKEGNPFFLSIKERCLMFKNILEKDNDALIPLMELLSRNKWDKQKFVSDEYLIALKERLEYFKSFGITYEKRLHEIRGWGKAEKYLEHFVPPRIHWLLDLKLLDWEKYKDGIYSLDKTGCTFLNSMERAERFKVIDKNWLDTKYYNIFYNAFGKEIGDIKLLRELPYNSQEKIIFEQFKTIFPKLGSNAIPKITASQFMEWVCITLLIEKKILTSWYELRNILKRMTNMSSYPIFFRWIPSVNDGYILIKK